MGKVIGIIGGKGRMGNYFAEFFRKNNYEVLISDKGTKLSNAALARVADVVIVAVPIAETVEVIEEVAPLVKKTGLLMDLTSLKEAPMEAMKTTKASYLGCHPLFGPTQPIEGQLVVVCAGHGDQWLKWFTDLLKKNGAAVRPLTAAKHDELMAYVQVLTHFVSITFAGTLKDSGLKIEDLLATQSPVYRLTMGMMGRILAQDPNLYAQIQIHNPRSRQAVQSFVRNAARLALAVETSDVSKFVHYFTSAADFLGDYRKTALEETNRVISSICHSERSEESADSSVASLPRNDKKGRNDIGDIAVLGPPGSFSDLALKKDKVKIKDKVLYCASISDVFDRLSKKQVKEALVPLENSLSGSVRETLDELYRGNFWIKKVVHLPIHLALVMSSSGSSLSSLRKQGPMLNGSDPRIKSEDDIINRGDDIRVVYSHPQALLQCRAFLKKYLPGARALPVGSTSAAMEKVAHEGRPDAAAIASAIGAETHGLKILKDGIEDDPSNTTTFAVVILSSSRALLSSSGLTRGPGSRLDSRFRGNDKLKTSIALELKSRPGALFGVLKNFADAKINLTKIESRPNPKKSGEYVFYIDFEGNASEASAKKILEIIKKKVTNLKVLGCY